MLPTSTYIPLSVALTVLFPVFASYKALHTSDPAILAPWLMYFVTLSLVSTLENTFDFILSWVPFYSWLRLALHIYLLLPGSSGGASFLYETYIEPFLYHHEREIDDFITDAHDRARAAGLAYLQQAIEWFKVRVLGFAPAKEQAVPAAPGQSYAQTFMSRFSMQSARGGTDNLSNLVSQALSGASALYSGNTSAQADSLARDTNLIPPSIRNNDDRASYVASQRERLEGLLRAFDREQDNLRQQRESGSRYHEHSRESTFAGKERDSGVGGLTGISRNRSETEFDRIERDEVASQGPPYPITPPVFERQPSQGWMPWNWRAGPAPRPAARAAQEEPLAYGRDVVQEREDEARARASGYEYGDR